LPKNTEPLNNRRDCNNPSPPLYNRIGFNYDETRHADPYITERIIACLKPVQSKNYLDIGCGTGNYTIVLHHKGICISGLDQSDVMISKARNKEPSICWYTADAEKIPIENNSFSGVVCTLAIHHFSNLDRVCSEVYRIIDKGQFVIFTATAEQMERYWLNHYFPDAMKKSIIQIPDQNTITGSLKTAGFTKIELEPYEINDNLKDLFLYSGKRHHERYLDKEFRSGISTFASLADKDEIKAGCEKLEKDIRSGLIARIISGYISVNGDYVFVTGMKE
jgi:SAM-dependent methyltransferase